MQILTAFYLKKNRSIKITILIGIYILKIGQIPI